jgi:dihydroflavonol-4-reductase
VIFHTAGVVAVWGTELARLPSVNVVGTQNVLDAAGRVARVVHTSSVMTIGATRRPEPLTEEDAFDLNALKVDYVHVKRASEHIALEAAARGQDVVVTNPGYLVGPEDYHRSVMGRFCKRFWKGRIPVAPPGGFNLSDVRDVARGHLLAAEHGQAGRRYILGGENRTFPEFMALLAEVASLSPRGLPRIPCWTLSALAALSEVRSKLTEKEPYPSFQHVRLNRFYWFYRSDRAALELGYRTRPLIETLADTYQWHTAQDVLTVEGLNRWWMRPRHATLPASVLEQAA